MKKTIGILLAIIGAIGVVYALASYILYKIEERYFLPEESEDGDYDDVLISAKALHHLL